MFYPTTYNFNFEPIFSRKNKKLEAKKKVMHEPIVVKQAVYFLIMTCLNLGCGHLIFLMYITHCLDSGSQ